MQCEKQGSSDYPEWAPQQEETIHIPRGGAPGENGLGDPLTEGEREMKGC